ncbi:MAG TPA: nuclear transport factor 2 family protein [Solirubrobacteraceae bacterium]|jgi:glyoxylase-like metal-dependent hydrolase (beta-lactamase superfamily II)/predicted ester cyclase|nr:nuclear transport factor 2 family protein [Solirubrobacteraceae bacterium]
MAEAETDTQSTQTNGSPNPEAERPKKSTKAETARLVRSYFEAIAAGDREAQSKYYAPDATGAIHGVFDGGLPVIVDYFHHLYASFPDFSFEVLDLIADGDRAAVHWRARGTFSGSEPYQGIAPNGARVQTEGVDFVRVRDGKLVRNDAFADNMTVARQIGLLPEVGSKADQRVAKAFNLKTRLVHRVGGVDVEPVAEGVWVLRGGFPSKTMNVYLVADGDGVLLFDAGIKTMTNGVAAAAASMGGLTRVILGHGHADHRGVAPGLHVPVYCHPAERADAEGDAGAHYFQLEKLNPVGRMLLSSLLPMWDGGPVQIDGTVSEGDRVADFEVIELPGHAPGLIGLWRESDRLALVSDCFYTLDPQTGRKGHARVPHAAFNHDTEQARQSMRKLAALEPSAAWAGHADPLLGDVRATLEHAADTT